MGVIIFKLAKQTLKDKSDILPARLITEENTGEDFHIHFRNVRLEFSEQEFVAYCEHIGRSFSAHKAGKGVFMDDGRENFAKKYYVLDQTVLNASAECSPTKFQIELNYPELIHIHYRNMRIELSKPEFMQMAINFAKAAFNLKWKSVVRKFSNLLKKMRLSK